MSYSDEYNKLRNKRKNLWKTEEEDIAPVAKTLLPPAKSKETSVEGPQRFSLPSPEESNKKFQDYLVSLGAKTVAEREEEAKKRDEEAKKREEEAIRQAAAAIEATFATNEDLSSNKEENTNGFWDWLASISPGGSASSYNSRKASADTDVKEDDDRTWFDLGSFEDGYDVGDVTKSILGTISDTATNIYQGAFSLPEAVIDTGAYLVGGGAKLFGADDFADDVSEWIAGDLIDERKAAETVVGLNGGYAADFVADKVFGWGEITDEENSMLGEKSQGVAQSIGQWATQVALTSAGVPWWLTSGVQSFGSGVEEGFKEGEDYGKVGFNSATKAGVEMLTEKLFGGSGLGEKGLINTQALTKNISNKSVKALLDFGIDVYGEGEEEAISAFFGRLTDNLTYEREETWMELLTDEEAMDDYINNVIQDMFSEEAKEERLESRIGGMFIGGIANAGKTKNSVKNGTDYHTGLTKNDQKVFDKLYNDALSAKEKESGKKPTSKEKAEIYDSVMEQMEKGYISTDTIEEVLGGDDYKAYKDSLDSDTKRQQEYDDWKEEYDALYNTKGGDKSDAQIDRQSFLKKQIDEFSLDSNTENLRRSMSRKVYDSAKDGVLAESYRERARKTQAFQADLSQYKGKQREAVDRAIKSGVLNNTNRSHELVDILSKLEADKGVIFDYTNNAKLKESGFSVDGKTVNGFEKGGTVTLNVQSAKAWQSVVGHEITHVLEGTDAYTALQTALYKYAEGKGELASRKANLTELYKDIKDADIDAELTADLVGDYLFSDSDFIKHLTTDRNVFQKVYDEIKYLCKVATGKELTEIEKVKREFDKAWEELSVEENEATDSEIDDVNFSVSVEDKNTLDFLNEQISRGEYDAETNPNGGYYVTYKSMSYWGTDENGNAILRSPMAEYVDGELSNAYLIPKDKSKLNWYQATETIDENTGLPSGLLVKTRKEGNKNDSYLPAAENQDLIKEDWSNLFFELNKKVFKNGKWKDSPVKARYNPYEHSSNSMLNDQFKAAFQRDNLVTVKMYVPVSEDNGTFRAKYSKDATGWSDWKSGDVATKINKQKDLQRKVYLSRYAAPVEIVPDSEVAQAYKEYLDGTDVTIPDNVVSPNLLNELKKAGVPITESGKVKYSLSSMANTFFGDENMSSVAFEESDYKQTDGYKNYVEQCVNNMRQTRTDFDETVAREEIEKQIDGLVRVAKAAKKAGYDIVDDAKKRDKKDSKNRLLFSSLEPNSDYFTSSDISTICDKRKNFAEIYDDIVRAEEEKGVPQGKRFFDNVDNYFYLHNVLAQKGLTQPCRQCYVESMRKNLAPMANAFLRLVNETDVNNKANDQLYQQSGKNKGELKSSNAELREKVLETFKNNPEYNMTASDLTVEMLTTEDGLAQLKIQAPLVYEAFNSFYGQSKPKMPKSATPFRLGELTALLTDHHGKIKQSLVDKINSTGGFRLQSYSDFQIQNYADVLQVIFEAGTLGLNGHAYTKVPAFLEATEGTNLKRNISIFMYKDGNEWKIDKNDSFPYELEEIYNIVNADKSGNTGIVAVSQNKDMSCWIMANDNIAYGIPFHKSGMKMGTVRDTDVKTDDGRIIKGYSGIIDHTKQQTEVWANTTEDHKALTKVKKGINIYGEEVGWDFNNTENLSKNELIEKNVKSYIDACERAGYLPKFRDYVMNNDAVLNATLNYAKELGFVSPDATIGDISFEYKGYTIPYGYYKFLGDFSVFTPDGEASPHDTLSLNNYDFDKAESFFADAEKLHRNEILQQFANDGERQKYRDSNLTAEELTEIVKQKRKEVVDDIVAPIKNSLSNVGERFAPIGNYSTPLNETALAPIEDIAPVREDIATESVAPTVAEMQSVTGDVTPAVSKNTVEQTDDIAPIADVIPKPTAPFPDEIAPMTEEEANAVQDEKAKADAKLEGEPKTRKQLHSNIISHIKSVFSGKGFDFDSVLKNAKNLSTFSTVDNTPQRVMEKALGYKEGQALADITVNRVAQNETEGIKWLNTFTDRKKGFLAQISKQYNIKPGSKESAAAQMYAEGFYVTENNEIVAYGDAELAKDFPKIETQYNIKGLANDPRIRKIYDDTLYAINESRRRNAYPEIQKLDNYFLHFRAMDDTFSKLGLPFNPNDIKAKDLPTDLNGVTADLKPGQPYFASANHRTGKRTSFDLLGGLERYLTSAKNQIYHIDDIQTLRALRNYIADTYGQANGLEGIDALTEEEAQEKIEQVYNSHLSTFAKFLNEEANVIAGKTALIDRGLEGVIGRRGMTFLDTVRKQTGSNMVGFNVSSSLTNFLPVTQTFAKSNKADFIKAFAQTVSNKFGAIVGKGDGFAENSPVMIRRKGTDRFYRTPFQKAADTGYVLMGAVDSISTELIARTKFNEFVRKGMSEQQAHIETDKWVSRLMGDRSLGQQPQLYNSKTLGFITQFQLEVRNQLDSQFYDTIQEAKVSNEDIQNGLERNAKTAAKVTSTFVQLAVAQHLFGKAFESVAGYNPAFDIIEVLSTLFGFDDDEESEDTALDNIEQGFLALLEDLPYTSAFTGGGRIPISSALPISELITGKDSYGNEKSRWDTLGETIPYYMLPSGYGQIKKTTQGLSMFDEDLPVSGSYTDSGNLRFPVEDTFGNRLQAGLFGQYASENAREYFDNDYAPLKEKQIQEYIDVDMPISDYWKYREGLSGLKTNEEKAKYINDLDISDEQKNILMNNILDRKEDVDMSNYDDYSGWEEFDYATKNPEKYEFFTSNGISYETYSKADEDGKNAYNWAYNNPEKYTLSKAVTDDVVTYRKYANEMYDIKADKDEDGKSINGSRKEKVINYLNDLDLDYEAKIILFKIEYPSDDTYNNDIVNYINNLDGLTYEERVTIFTELGFIVQDGYVNW